MRFPFRLTADILRAKLVRLAGSQRAAICHATHEETSIARALASSSPVIWLGGAQPLLDPEIGRATNGLVELNRHVFLHTDGLSLRQRIHAFRPDSRLFLTLEFFGREELHNKVSGRSDAFRRSLEGIRAAKLSGFLVAAHITVSQETDACDVGELIECLDKMDMDGFLVSARGRSLIEGNTSLAENLADVRAMIRSGRWESLSRLLEASYAAAFVRSTAAVSTAGENVFEEGD